MITLRINQTPYQFPSNISLVETLKNLDLGMEGIAVAVNRHIIRRSEWEHCTLQDNDKVLIIKATQGG